MARRAWRLGSLLCVAAVPLICAGKADPAESFASLAAGEIRRINNPTTLAEFLAAMRALYFYIPPVPTPAVFPTARGAQLIGTCTLGKVRVEMRASTPEFGSRVGQELQQRFHQHGRGMAGMDVAERRSMPAAGEFALAFQILAAQIVRREFQSHSSRPAAR